MFTFVTQAREVLSNSKIFLKSGNESQAKMSILGKLYGTAC
jgi:hypothetical protein